MTYIADLDPNSPVFADPDETVEDRDLDRFVDYFDVENPEEGVVTGYGGDHRTYIPGAFEPSFYC
mgnify:CR=1 FL=1